jgi:molecular chaperone DnaJ
MSKNYYDILGVDKSVSENDLKKAYRKLSKKYHPDLNPDNKEAEDKFKDIAEAYDVLSNKEKRQNYDMFGNPNGRQGNPFGGGMDMDDIFNQFFGGGQRRSQVRKPKGRDLRVNIKVSLEEIYTGAKKKFKYRHIKMCEPCGGFGGDNDVCNQCNDKMVLALIVVDKVELLRNLAPNVVVEVVLVWRINLRLMFLKV